jgi:hypothetical protein
MICGSRIERRKCKTTTKNRAIKDEYETSITITNASNVDIVKTAKRFSKYFGCKVDYVRVNDDYNLKFTGTFFDIYGILEFKESDTSNKLIKLVEFYKN